MIFSIVFKIYIACGHGVWLFYGLSWGLVL